MKKLMLFVCLFVISILTYSQEKFSTYDNVYTKKTYDIQISVKDNFATLWIDVLSLDNSVDKVGYKIDEDQLPGFIDNLNEAKLKYIEWVKTAKDNNVTDVSKNIDLTKKSQKISGYFKYGDWQFDYNVRLEYDFRIYKNEGTDKINYVLIVRSGKMQSMSNQFMDCKDAVIVFGSSDEITDFINIISLDKISSYKNKPKSEELFK